MSILVLSVVYWSVLFLQAQPMVRAMREREEALAKADSGEEAATMTVVWASEAAAAAAKWSTGEQQLQPQLPPPARQLAAAAKAAAPLPRACDCVPCNQQSVFMTSIITISTPTCSLLIKAEVFKDISSSVRVQIQI